MRRREFIAGLGSAAAWPLAALAQQRDRLGRVGILFGGSENNPEQQSWLAAFMQELARLGWVEARNVRIDRRWTNDDADFARIFAKELVGLQPDVILSRSCTIRTLRLGQNQPLVSSKLLLKDSLWTRSSSRFTTKPRSKRP